MIYIEQNALNKIFVDVSSATGITPTFLWNLQNSQGMNVKNFIPRDITSTYPSKYAGKYRVFEFSTIPTLPENLTPTGSSVVNIYMPNLNQFWLSIYEQSSPSNLNPSNAVRVLNQLAFSFWDKTQEYYTGNTGNVADNVIYYDTGGVVPSPTPNPTPSSTQTPTPTPTPTNTSTPTPTPTITPSSTSAPVYSFSVRYDSTLNDICSGGGLNVNLYGLDSVFENNSNLYLDPSFAQPAVNGFALQNSTGIIIQIGSSGAVLGVVVCPTPTPTNTGTPTPTPTSTTTPTPTPTNPNLFELIDGFDNNVNVLLLDEPNNSLYVGGTFGFYQGNNNLYLTKISTNGTWDSGFQSGLPFQTTGRSVRTIIQSETANEIYIGGEFPTYSGLTTGNFTRINKNTGLQVSGWDGTNANNVVSNGILDGNQVVLVGAFVSYKGTTRNRIVRLNSNNSVDASIFGGAAFNAAPLGILKNNAGNYVVYGGATTYFGANIGRIVEIDPTTGNNTGLFGTGFGATTFNEAAYDPTTGYYYCVGNLTMSYQGGAQSFIYVLDGTGAVVSSTAPFVSTLNCFGIYGDFANDALYLAFSAPTGFRKVIISTWTEDTTWATNRGVINGTSAINAGKFGITDSFARTYLGGTFTRYNDQNYNRLIRLNSNGTSNTLGS